MVVTDAYGVRERGGVGSWQVQCLLHDAITAVAAFSRLRAGAELNSRLALVLVLPTSNGCCCCSHPSVSRPRSDAELNPRLMLVLLTL